MDVKNEKENINSNIHMVKELDTDAVDQSPVVETRGEPPPPPPSSDPPKENPGGFNLFNNLIGAFNMQTIKEGLNDIQQEAEKARISAMNQINNIQNEVAERRRTVNEGSEVKTPENEAKPMDFADLWTNITRDTHNIVRGINEHIDVESMKTGLNTIVEKIEKGKQEATKLFDEAREGNLFGEKVVDTRDRGSFNKEAVAADPWEKEYIVSRLENILPLSDIPLNQICKIVEARLADIPNNPNIFNKLSVRVMDPTFDKWTVTTAAKVLQRDSAIAKYRYRLVPAKLSEECFWYNYFCLVETLYETLETDLVTCGVTEAEIAAAVEAVSLCSSPVMENARLEYSTEEIHAMIETPQGKELNDDIDEEDIDELVNMLGVKSDVNVSEGDMSKVDMGMVDMVEGLSGHDLEEDVGKLVQELQGQGVEVEDKEKTRK